MNEEPNTEIDLSQRFSRQIGVIGSAAQQRIDRSTVTIIGAGGLGSLMTTQLAMMGTHRLRKIDPDNLGVENLDRTIGVGLGDCGHPKVIAALRHLKAIRPDMTVAVMAESATAPQANRFLRERTDLLLTCVDDEACRLRVAEIANETMTIHMDVGTSIQRRPDGELTMVATVRLCLPGEGCLACIGGIESIPLQRERLRPRPPGTIPPQLAPTWDRQRAGSLVTFNMIAAGTAGQLWLELLMGRIQNSVWLQIEWSIEEESSRKAARNQPHSALVGELNPVTRVPGCEICGRWSPNP